MDRGGESKKKKTLSRFQEVLSATLVLIQSWKEMKKERDGKGVALVFLFFVMQEERVRASATDKCMA